ncbi:radical SAM protein [Desulfoglaeba alkanexedens]|uniref:Radical SAM protein n=1 Tax=Desulfoglaeba alkanexedens ALDC TaxID=980445 RepID=A0A4P8L2Y7_9BACT|nr:radical SAM protein [Desulfoglaeba alkanexedens]QCQ22297.1 radical SAM protein [Desulfoglaeba alkanexedens ALDC]
MVVSYIAIHHPEKCVQCGACIEIVACPGADKGICLGCGACVLACPNQALELVEQRRESEVTIEVDGRLAGVPARITVKEALAGLGYPVSSIPGEPGLFAPCMVGGCGSCAVEVDSEVRLACRTEVAEGMRIRTRLPEGYIPKRLVMGFNGHPAGGVGTPWQIKGKSSFIEVVCFTAGCNFRCPQCQNWLIAYRGKGDPLTPQEAARKLTQERKNLKLNRMTISGGECTLNRPWLVQFIRELKVLNPDPEAHFHVDTNGSLLTHDYIDELVEAGMTDIGIDLKALEISTFMRITGLTDQEQANKYKEIAWEAVSYIIHKYSGKVFLGVGIPYNKELNSIVEVSRIGERLGQIDPSIQVNVLNYSPEFRSRITPPSDKEMEAVGNALREVGLKTVLCQTARGIIGP